VTLTASHCLNLTTNLEYDFFRYFYIVAEARLPIGAESRWHTDVFTFVHWVWLELDSRLPARSTTGLITTTSPSATPVRWQVPFPLRGCEHLSTMTSWFAYTETNLTGSFVAPCTTLPAVGQTVYVTGLRLGSKIQHFNNPDLGDLHSKGQQGAGASW